MSTTSRSAWPQRRRRGNGARDVVERLAVAMAAVDRHGIRAELHGDVTLVVDSGGQDPLAPGTAHGGEAVTARLLELLAPATSVSLVSINGDSGFVLIRDDRVVGAVTVEVRSGLLSRIWVVSAPEKLRYWSRPTA